MKVRHYSGPCAFTTWCPRLKLCGPRASLTKEPDMFICPLSLRVKHDTRATSVHVCASNGEDKCSSKSSKQKNLLSAHTSVTLGLNVSCACMSSLASRVCNFSTWTKKYFHREAPCSERNDWSQPLRLLSSRRLTATAQLDGEKQYTFHLFYFDVRWEAQLKMMETLCIHR